MCNKKYPAWDIFLGYPSEPIKNLGHMEKNRMTWVTLDFID